MPTGFAGFPAAGQSSCSCPPPRAARADDAEALTAINRLRSLDGTRAQRVAKAVYALLARDWASL